MTDYSPKYPGRRYDEMFYADDDQIRVDKVQAFVCPPNDDDTRWVPEKGYNVSVGGSVFKTERAAEKGLVRKLTQERQRLVKRLAAIDAYLARPE